jgi:hypothetical protein
VEGEAVDDDAEEQRSQVRDEYRDRGLDALSQLILGHGPGEKENKDQEVDAQDSGGSEDVVAANEVEMMRKQSGGPSHSAGETEIGARLGDGLQQQLNHGGDVEV